MEKTILILLSICCVCCNKPTTSTTVDWQATNTVEDSTIPDSASAHLKLKNKHFDFGKIDRKKHPAVSVDVPFINSGNTPLVILKADVSCGCLTAEFPKKPILSGQSGTITLHADLRAQEGVFNKSVFIKSTADNDVVLIRIAGVVKK